MDTVYQWQISRESALELQHRWMRHADKQIIKRLIPENVYGMRSNYQPSLQYCEIRTRKKHCRLPATSDLLINSENTTIHADVGGPFQMKTERGKRYFLTMTTSAQRHTEMELLREKRKVWGYIRNFIAWPEVNKDHKVRRVHTENVKAFIAPKRKLSLLGIKFTTTCASNDPAE